MGEFSFTYTKDFEKKKKKKKNAIDLLSFKRMVSYPDTVAFEIWDGLAESFRILTEENNW